MCDWVIGSVGSAERLQAIEQSNLFLVSLDGRGEWYRYHNLFRELVHAQLVASDPSALPDLNRRAAAWCIEHGLIEDALEYAWATGHPAELADLLQTHYLDMARAGRFTTFNGWLQRLPDSALTERPVLCASGVLMSMMAAQPAPIRRRYAALAEAGLETRPAPERWRAQALVSLTRGGVLDIDLGKALACSTEATGLALEHVSELAVAALATLAYAHYLAGDAALARSTADQALNRPEAAQRPHGVVYAHAVHALLECDAGRVQVAEKEALHAVARAATWASAVPGPPGSPATRWARRCSRAATRETPNESSAAPSNLRQAGEPRLDTMHSLIQLARARTACGKLAAAASNLDAVDQLLSSFSDAGTTAGHGRRGDASVGNGARR